VLCTVLVCMSRDRVGARERHPAEIPDRLTQGRLDSPDKGPKAFRSRWAQSSGSTRRVRRSKFKADAVRFSQLWLAA